jgi:ribosome recycling factor
MADIDTIKDDTEERMMNALDALQNEFSSFRTGKASPALVENLMVMVESYGTQMRLKEIAGITTPEPRLLVIQPWDPNSIPDIEKAIQSSNVGIAPQNDGRVIRLPIPELSEERRLELGKQIKARSEETKVEIRNHRRDANEIIKKAQGSSDITEDGMHDLLKDVQKLTDDYIKNVETDTAKKEADVMTV